MSHNTLKSKSLLQLLVSGLGAGLLLGILFMMVWPGLARAADPPLPEISLRQDEPVQTITNEPPLPLRPVSDLSFDELRLTNPVEAVPAGETNLGSQRVQPGETPQGLPADAWQRMLAAIRQDRYRIQPNQEEAGYRATNHSQALDITFIGTGGVELGTGGLRPTPHAPRPNSQIHPSSFILQEPPHPPGNGVCI